MTLAEAIRAKMLANGPLSAMVGSRIYPVKLPQNPTYPAITYSRVAGGYKSDTAVGSPIYQFDIWADGYSSAENLCTVMRASLEREKFISGSIEVLHCSMNGEPRDMYDDGVKKYRVSVEFKINYREV